MLIASRLRNNKTSVDLKEKVYKRHIKFFAIFSVFLVYSIMWIFDVNIRNRIMNTVKANEWSSLDDDELDKLIKNYYELVNGILFNIPAIPIGLLRIMEPYVFQEVKRVWNLVICRKNKKI